MEKQIKKRQPAEYISSPKTGVPIVKRKMNSSLFGYHRWDRVQYTDKESGEKVKGYITALRLSGSFSLATLGGDKVSGGKSYNKLELLKPCLSNYVRKIVPLEETPTELRDPEQLVFAGTGEG